MIKCSEESALCTGHKVYILNPLFRTLFFFYLIDSSRCWCSVTSLKKHSNISDHRQLVDQLTTAVKLSMWWSRSLDMWSPFLTVQLVHDCQHAKAKLWLPKQKCIELTVILIKHITADKHCLMLTYFISLIDIYYMCAVNKSAVAQQEAQKRTDLKYHFNCCRTSSLQRSGSN